LSSNKKIKLKKTVKGQKPRQYKQKKANVKQNQPENQKKKTTVISAS